MSAIDKKLEFIQLLAGNLRREISTMTDTTGSIAKVPSATEHSKVEELTRPPRMISGLITDTQRLNLSFDFVWLDTRIKELEQQERDLKKLYEKLKGELQAEKRECEQRKEQIRNAVKYGQIEEPMAEDAHQKASAPTNLFNS